MSRVRWFLGVVLAVFATTAVVEARERLAVYRVILSIDSLKFGRDSLKVGDSVQATAIPYNTNGRVCETCPVDWYDYPLSKINIHIKDLYGHVAWIVATGAAPNTKMSVRWKRTSASILRDTDSIKTYVVGLPPGSEVPPPTSGQKYQLIPISPAGACMKSGTPITATSTCLSTDTTSLWIPPAANVAGFLVGNNGKCLMDSAGTKIKLDTCSTRDDQKWLRTGYTGSYQNVASSLCLANNTVTHLVVPTACGVDGYKTWTTEPIGFTPDPGPSTPPVTDATCTSADSVPASQSHPHEPAAMTVLHTHAGLNVMPCGWFNATGQISIVTDTEKGSVLQLAMQGLTTPGSGTARLDSRPEVGTFGATKIYFAMWEKLSPNFKGNDGAGVLKNVIMHSQATYGGLPNGAFHFPGFINDPSNVDSRIQVNASFVNMLAHDGVAINPANNVLYYAPANFDRMSRGVWHFIEGVYTMNAKGTANGSFQIWIDGQSVAPTNATQLVYVDGLTGSGLLQSDVGMPRFTGIELTNVFGGGGTVFQVDNWYRFKDIYISGGYARSGETPDHWTLTSVEGNSVVAGTVIHVKAQLVDGNGNSVDICGLQPTITLTNNATWIYWPGTDTPAPPGCENGRQNFAITVPSGGTNITVTDYATKWNGQRGATRTGSQAITNP